MSDFPTLQDELDRKTVETLHEIAWKGENHALTRQLVEVAAKAVWQVTAGLVNRDISFLAEQLAKPKEQLVLRRHFVGTQGVVTLAWKPSGTKFVMAKRSHLSLTKRDGITHPYADVETRNRTLDALVASLIGRGYVEL